MEYVLIIHEVQDYEAWKKVFDDATSIRKEAGEQSYQVLKYENNANKIVHFSKWISIAQAKAFFESPKLVEIRKQAGVKAPEFIYLELLEEGVLDPSLPPLVLVNQLASTEAVVWSPQANPESVQALSDLLRQPSSGGEASRIEYKRDP